MLAVDRYALSTYAQARRPTSRQAYDAYDFQADLPRDQRVRDGGSERVLSGRLEGSALHVRRGVAASGGRRRRRCMSIADGLARLIGADPVDHGRRNLGAAARQPRGLGAPGGVSGRMPRGWRDEALEAEWASLLEVRSAVNAALEVARQAKDDRQRPVGAGHRVGIVARRSSRAAGTVRRGPADAVHHVGGGRPPGRR